MILNKTTGRIISQKERYCRTIISQALGLMFRRKQNLIMEFPREQQVSLHMMMVFFPIDVILLDKEKKVVEIKRNLKPWRMWSSAVPVQYVIELGRIKSGTTKSEKDRELKGRVINNTSKPLAVSLDDQLEIKRKS